MRERHGTDAVISAHSAVPTRLTIGARTGRLNDPDALALKEPDHRPAPLGVAIADQHAAGSQHPFNAIGEMPHGLDNERHRPDDASQTTTWTRRDCSSITNTV